MANFKHLAIICTAVLLAQFCSATVEAQQPRKLAFVVGVSEYQKTGLTNLSYAHKDANDLSAELQRNGFEVTKLIGRDAKHEVVRAQLAAFLKKTNALRKRDMVLLSFSGHGLQKEIPVDKRKIETPFVCVYDSLVTKPETMISLNAVIKSLETESACGSNLLMVDACRNNPDKGVKTLDGSTVRNLPAKVSMLFSSTAGQKSFESDKAKQGVFTYVLLKGLQGEAANRSGQVSWLGLANYVVQEVPLVAPELVGNKNVIQRPNLVGNITSSTLLAVGKKVASAATPNSEGTVSKPDSVPSDSAKVPILVAPFGKKEISRAIAGLGRSKGMIPVWKNKLGMEFRLIPAGKFKMGSSDSEKGRRDNERQQAVEISRPFFMSTFEVTQTQWVELMGSNPSSFSKGGYKADEIKGEDASSYPVECISWEDVEKFISLLNERYKTRTTNYRYALPTEAQWEYCCRAGTETVFHFGDVLTSKDANCAWSYGSNSQGRYLERTTKVGSYMANEFGLHDMHGNVSEWCNDRHHIGSARVLRGGGWNDDATYCRSANSFGYSHAHNDIGFRVVLLGR